MYEMDEKCQKCKNNGTVICNRCDMYYDEFDPIDESKQTHYDRIRAMSIEELAEWLAEVLFHCSNTICDQRCPMYECCCDQPSDNIEDWLKQEAE